MGFARGRVLVFNLATPKAGCEPGAGACQLHYTLSLASLVPSSLVFRLSPCPFPHPLHFFPALLFL